MPSLGQLEILIALSALSILPLQVSDVLRCRPLREVLLQTLPHIVRSSFFLAVNGGGFVAFICLVRWVEGEGGDLGGNNNC